LSNYWPKRSSPNGFSIEELAKQYREKISKLSLDNSSTVKEEKELAKSSDEQISLLRKSEKSCHWANRQFYEYLDAA